MRTIEEYKNAPLEAADILVEFCGNETPHTEHVWGTQSGPGFPNIGQAALLEDFRHTDSAVMVDLMTPPSHTYYLCCSGVADRVEQKYIDDPCVDLPADQAHAYILSAGAQIPQDGPQAVHLYWGTCVAAIDAEILGRRSPDSSCS